MKISETPPGKPIPSAAGERYPEKEAVRPEGGLRDGQLVKGRVLELTADGRSAQLDIDGKRVVAQNLAELQTGKSYWFEVRRGGAQPWLSLAGQKGPLQELLRLTLADSLLLKQVVASLTSGGAQPEAVHPDPPPKAAVFPLAGLTVGRATNLTGLLRLLETLGPQATPEKTGGLLETLGQNFSPLLRGGAKESAAFRAASNPEKLLHLLETLQAVNQSADSGRPAYYLFPCFMAGEAGWGQWWLGPDHTSRQPGQAEEAMTIAFFLQLSRLGDLALQFRMEDQQVQGEVVAPSSAVQEYLEGRLGELKDLLRRLDLHPLHLRCRVARGSVVRHWQGFLQEKAAFPRQAILDVIT